jgi:uncharacterized RDD family membrane protein YckC
MKSIKKMLLAIGLSGLAISLLVYAVGTDATVVFSAGIILEIIGFFLLITAYSEKD